MMKNNPKNKKEEKAFDLQRILVFFLAVILLLAALAAFFDSGRGYRQDTLGKVKELDRDWECIDSNGVKTMENLPHKLDCTGEGRISLSRILPETTPDKAQTIVMLSYYSNAYVYLEDELVYKYEYPGGIFSKTEGVVKHSVELPQNYSGKRLTIEFEKNIDIDYFLMYTPMMGDMAQIVIYNFRKNIDDLLTVIALIAMGIILILFNMLSEKELRMVTNFGYIGAFSIIIGIYLGIESRLMYFLSDNYKLIYFADYFTLMLLTLPYFLMFYRYNKKLFGTLAVANSLYVFTVAFCYFALGKEPREMIQFVTGGVVMFCVMLLLALIAVKWPEDVKVRLRSSIGIICVGGVLEIAAYYINGFTIGNCIKICLLVFIGIHIFYGLGTYKKAYKALREAEIYSKMAYFDMLTGLGNRNAYQKAIAELENGDKKHKSISCFVFDLDGLKTTNDNLGHLAGDELLKAFAGVLKHTLKGAYGIYRTGGDEFFALCPDLSDEQQESALNEVFDRCRQYSDKASTLLHASGGCAKYVYGQSISIEDAIAEADRLMYNRKNGTHRKVQVG